VVFSKDSLVHIADKHALMGEVFRVLKARGPLHGLGLADRS